MFVGDEIYEAAPARPLALTKGSHGGVAPRARVGDLRDLRDYVARYDGEIRFAEEQLAKLWKVFEELELDRRTLVVFTSDDGESLGEHDYFFAHGTYVFEPTARLPLLLYHPQWGVHGVVREVVRSMDILPTVLELLGLPVPEAVEGESFLELLFGSTLPRRIAPICSGRERYMTLAARNERWKLVWTPRRWRWLDLQLRMQLVLWNPDAAAVSLRQRSYRKELYDLWQDPAEGTPLRGAPAEPLELLEGEILRWIDRAPRGFHFYVVEEMDVEDLLERLRALGYVN